MAGERPLGRPEYQGYPDGRRFVDGQPSLELRRFGRDLHLVKSPVSNSGQAAVPES